MNLWRRRVGAPFGPFPGDKYILQRYLKFAKFWVSVLDLLFQVWSLVSIPLFSKLYHHLWSWATQSQPWHLPLFHSLYSIGLQVLPFFPRENPYHLYCPRSSVGHCSLPPGPLGSMLTVPHPLTCTLHPLSVVNIKWPLKHDILSISLSISLHRLNL